jgi:hypothetical protein
MIPAFALASKEANQAVFGFQPWFFGNDRESCKDLSDERSYPRFFHNVSTIVTKFSGACSASTGTHYDYTIRPRFINNNLHLFYAH